MRSPRSIAALAPVLGFLGAWTLFATDLEITGQVDADGRLAEVRAKLLVATETRGGTEEISARFLRSRSGELRMSTRVGSESAVVDIAHGADLWPSPTVATPYETRLAELRSAIGQD